MRVPAPGYFVWRLKVTLLKASKAVVAVSDRGKLSISKTSEEEKRKNNNKKKGSESTAERCDFKHPAGI